jgi:hypothetical protein
MKALVVDDECAVRDSLRPRAYEVECAVESTDAHILDQSAARPRCSDDTPAARVHLRVFVAASASVTVAVRRDTLRLERATAPVPTHPDLLGTYGPAHQAHLSLGARIDSRARGRETSGDRGRGWSVFAPE